MFNVMITGCWMKACLCCGQEETELNDRNKIDSGHDVTNKVEKQDFSKMFHFGILELWNYLIRYLSMQFYSRWQTQSKKTLIK